MTVVKLQIVAPSSEKHEYGWAFINPSHVSFISNVIAPWAEALEISELGTSTGKFYVVGSIDAIAEKLGLSTQ